jgi:hypothetical protein
MSINVRVMHYIYDEVVSPLNPRRYIVLDGNFVFGLHGFDLRVSEKRNCGVKRDKSVIF